MLGGRSHGELLDIEVIMYEYAFVTEYGHYNNSEVTTTKQKYSCALHVISHFRKTSTLHHLLFSVGGLRGCLYKVSWIIWRKPSWQDFKVLPENSPGTKEKTLRVTCQDSRRLSAELTWSTAMQQWCLYKNESIRLQLAPS